MEGLADSRRRHSVGNRASSKEPCEFDPRPFRSLEEQANGRRWRPVANRMNPNRVLQVRSLSLPQLKRKAPPGGGQYGLNP